MGVFLLSGEGPRLPRQRKTLFSRQLRKEIDGFEDSQSWSRSPVGCNITTLTLCRDISEKPGVLRNMNSQSINRPYTIMPHSLISFVSEYLAATTLGWWLLLLPSQRFSPSASEVSSSSAVELARPTQSTFRAPTNQYSRKSVFSWT